MREARKKRGITIKKLAQDFGVLPCALCLCELGKVSTGELRARRLGEYFQEDWKLFLNKV